MGKYKKILCGLLMISLTLSLTGCNYIDYRKASTFIADGNYSDAITLFQELGDYKDSEAKILETKFLWACSLCENESFSDAITILEEISEYEPAKEFLPEAQYNYALKLFDAKQYDEALKYFRRCEDYKLTASALDSCAEKLCAEKEYGVAVEYYFLHDDSEEMMQELYYSILCEQMDNHNYEEVAELYTKIEGYKDTTTNDKFAGAKLLSAKKVSYSVSEFSWISFSSLTMELSFTESKLTSSITGGNCSLITYEMTDMVDISDSWEYQFDNRDILIKKDGEFVLGGTIGAFAEANGDENASVRLSLDLPGMWKVTDTKFEYE